VDELTSWLSRQSARDQRVVYLEDALLSDRFLAYAFYRLRFFFIRYGAASAVHAVSFVLLYHILPLGQFYTIILVQAAAHMVSAFWWGCLELMRGEIRRLYRSGTVYRIPEEVGRWLSLSLQLSLLMTAATAGWIVWRVAFSASSFSAADLFVACIGLRVAADLGSRCYHSGVYAVRRIYRPVRAMLAVQLAGFATTLAAWPFLHAWSLSIGAMVATVITTGLMIRYTRRAYHFMGFAPSEHLDLRHVRVPLQRLRTEGVAAGLSNVVMSLDSLLVIGLFDRGSRGPTSLFVLFFLVAPTVRAGARWAQLFYFDLKKLEVRLFNNLRERLDRYILRLAVVMGLVLWALACTISGLAYHRGINPLFWVIIPFFVARSLLAVVQVQAFAQGAYVRLLLSGLTCVVGFAAANILLSDDRLQVLVMALVAALSLCQLWAWAAVDRLRGKGPQGEVLWLSEWLAESRRVDDPATVSVARFRPTPSRPADGYDREWQEQDRWGQLEVAKQVARRLGRQGRATWIYPGRIAWFERASGAIRVTDEWLLGRSGGLLQSIEHTDVESGALAAVDVARRRHLLGSALATVDRESAAPVETKSLRSTFQAMFPRGVVYSPDEPAPPLFLRLNANARRMIMVDATRFARDFRRNIDRRSRFDVTAFCIAEELRLIFVVDRRVDPERRARWRALIRQANLQAALGPPAAPQEILPQLRISGSRSPLAGSAASASGSTP
jgi:hypothetical protein